jgi:hypothetical protein
MGDEESLRGPHEEERRKEMQTDPGSDHPVSREPDQEFEEILTLLRKTSPEQFFQYADDLLAAIKAHLPQLEQLLERINDMWCYEDGVYRFYHQSFKVYSLQACTTEATELFENIGKATGLERFNLNPYYRQIVRDGTGITFKEEHNRIWSEVARPIVEAFLHAKYFVEMHVKYGHELERAPQPMPSGWAALLCLYNLR